MAQARRLAAIVAVDVVGYSRLIGEDESGTVAAVRAHREAARRLVRERGGRIVKTMGDGLLLEFPSIVAAVESAILIQSLMVERNAGRPEEKRIVYRIGAHIGDVLVDSGDIFGDGVNIAARLETICEPGGLCISAAAHDHVRGRVSAEFTDLGERALKNIARPIRVFGLSGAAIAAAQIHEPASSAPLAPAPPAATEKRGAPRLSLVVLPFVNIGGDAEQEYFVDGVTESLTSDLSRIAGAFVIARNTAFTFKGKAVDIKAIGRELNVRYALEGSVQRGGNRMRVNVQLIDAESGAHLWAERFEKPIADLFDMQDEIVARLAAQLGAALIAVEARRAEKTPDPDAFDFYLRGLDWLNKGPHTVNLTKARENFRRALEIQPDNVEALIGSALADAWEVLDWTSENRTTRLAAAETSLVRALSLAPDSARAHFVLSVVKSYSNRAQQGVAEAERALSLDGNLAVAWWAKGLAKIFVGQPEETEDCVEKALRLSPRDPLAFVFMGSAGAAALHLGAYDGAARWLARSATANPYLAIVHFFLAAALAQAGRLAEAPAETRAGLALSPAFSIRHFREQPDCDNVIYLRQRENMYEGMRLAGVPE